MKVLHAIIIAPHMPVSGAVTAARHLAAALAAHCEVDVVQMSAENRLEEVGALRVRHLSCSNLLSFTRAFLPDKFRTLLFRSSIPKIIEDGSYDIVHIHNPIPGLEMKRVAAACVRSGTPYVVSTHGFNEISSGGEAYGLTKIHEKLAWRWLIEGPVKYVVENASRIFLLSPLERDTLLHWGVEEKNLRVVTNGVDQRYLESSSQASVASVRARFDLPETASAPTCIFVGNHTKNKGIELLVESFRGLDQPFTLVVCGKKRPVYDYEALSRTEGPDQRIVFTDFISDEEVGALLECGDLFVYPTLSDTLPLVVLEAMARRLPVVATRVGGIPHEVTEACGILVPPGDVAAFRTAVSNTLGRRSDWTAMGAAGRARVEEEFVWEAAAINAAGFYDELLAEGSRNDP